MVSGVVCVMCLMCVVVFSVVCLMCLMCDEFVVWSNVCDVFDVYV